MTKDEKAPVAQLLKRIFTEEDLYSTLLFVNLVL